MTPLRLLFAVGLVALLLLELFGALDPEPPQLGHADHAIEVAASVPPANPYAAQVDLGKDFVRLISYRPKARSGPLRAKVKAVAASAGSVWDRLSSCEAHGHWDTNTGNGYFGGLQEDLEFWTTYGPHRVDKDGNDLGLVAPRPDLAPRADQIVAAERARVGYAGHPARGYSPWPTCARRLGLNV